MIKVKFISHNKVIEAEEGENLLHLIRMADIFINAPCNGTGACGKCKVRIDKGKVQTKKTRHISEAESKQGYVLACASYVVEDIEVYVPKASSDDMHSMKIEDFSSDKEENMISEAKQKLQSKGMKFESSIKKLYMELDKPTLDDNISDVDRIKRFIRNNLEYDEIDCSLSIIRKIPHILRNSDFKITITYLVSHNKVVFINVEEGDTSEKLYGIALDIGTTSVASSLVDLRTGDIISKSSSGNAQIQYGADVINRIIYSTKGNGLEKLNEVIIKDTINPLIKDMCQKAKVDYNEIAYMVTAGNTTMIHLFLGIYPNYLRMDPYIPAITSTIPIKASEIGVNINENGFIYLAPCVASYVGGDITAGVLASGMWDDDENVLFIDLGTNGEIVFGNKEFLMSCACSAGPAFEGGEISSGMRAANGAIEKIEIDRKSYEPKFSTITNKAPIGICGSGIIDLISEMMLSGIVDRRGKISKELNISRIRFDENDIGEYVVAFKEEYGTEKDITITDVDIDNFIRAKGAVYSGITTLITDLGMDFTMIDKIYIAGGIGNNLNVENSIKIGLLPDIEREKIHYIGNSSLMGCYLTLISEEAKGKLEELSKQVTYVELSVNPSYMDEFVSACFLPHTDIEKFPSVKKLMS